MSPLPPPTIRNLSIDLHCKSIDWFLYDRNIGIKKIKPLIWQMVLQCWKMNFMQFDMFAWGLESLGIDCINFPYAPKQ